MTVRSLPLICYFVAAACVLSNSYNMPRTALKKRKPLTGAERQRQFRQRLMNHDADAAREKERLRWHRRRTAGKVKTINEMDPREQRSKRKQWKADNQRRAIEKKRETELQLNAKELLLNSGSQGNSNENNVSVTSSLQDDIDTDTTPSHTYDVDSSTASRQKGQGRRVVRKDRAAAYRRIASLESALSKVIKQKNKYRKRAQRAAAARPEILEDRPNHDAVDETPRKKVRRLMTGTRHELRRELVFHYAMVGQLQERYREVQKQKKKAQVISKLFGTAGILMKYRVIDRARQSFGFSRKLMKSNVKRHVNILSYESIKEVRATPAVVVQSVKSFFLRDDITRPTAGKRETVTVHKVKKQKRFLLE